MCMCVLVLKPIPCLTTASLRLHCSCFVCLGLFCLSSVPYPTVYVWTARFLFCWVYHVVCYTVVFFCPGYATTSELLMWRLHDGGYRWRSIARRRLGLIGYPRLVLLSRPRSVAICSSMTIRWNMHSSGDRLCNDWCFLSIVLCIHGRDYLLLGKLEWSVAVGRSRWTWFGLFFQRLW